MPHTWGSDIPHYTIALIHRNMLSKNICNTESGTSQICHLVWVYNYNLSHIWRHQNIPTLQSPIVLQFRQLTTVLHYSYTWVEPAVWQLSCSLVLASDTNSKNVILLNFLLFKLFLAIFTSVTEDSEEASLYYYQSCLIHSCPVIAQCQINVVY